MEKCDAAAAKNFANAMDNDSIKDVRRLLTDCVNELRQSVPFNYGGVQKFLEMSANDEQKGVGLDLSMKYGNTKDGTADMLLGFTIAKPEK